MSALSPLEKATLRSLLTSFYTEHSDPGQLRSVFAMFDRNHDGKISRAELAVTLRALRSGVTDSRVDSMMDQADVNGDGTLDLREFIGAMQRAKA